MGRFDNTKATIDANIRQNGNQEITGQIMNSVLTEMMDANDAELTELDAPTESVKKYLDVTYVLLDAIGTDVAASEHLDLLKNGTDVLVENLSEGEESYLYIYAYKSDDSYDGYGSVRNGTSRVITLTDDYTDIKFWSSTPQHGKMSITTYGELGVTLKDVNLWEQVESGIPIEYAGYFAFDTKNIKVKDGETIKIQTGHNENYIIWSDGSFTSIKNNKFYNIKYPSGLTFGYIRVISDNTSEVTVHVLSIPQEFKNSVEKIISLDTPPIRALIIGDSYSEDGGRWIQPMIDSLPIGSSWISLAVGGASLRDKYRDRQTYPYTSRPTSSINEGNLNTFACQIEKLKRLMTGTDLDSGESPIYQTPESYPNVIIIEGGKNDSSDSEGVVDTYSQQINKELNNVYVKWHLSDVNAELGSVTIKTPLEEVDRTCFCGAYRYLIDELLSIFPNANIYITTVSPLYYKVGGDLVMRETKIAEQQRLCADLLNVTLIDWHRNGQVNPIMNYAQGSGTENDPYILAQCTLPNRDTNDQLHPNDRGGLKYGKCAARAIISTFINV